MAISKLKLLHAKEKRSLDGSSIGSTGFGLIRVTFLKKRSRKGGRPRTSTASLFLKTETGFQSGWFRACADGSVREGRLAAALSNAPFGSCGRDGKYLGVWAKTIRERSCALPNYRPPFEEYTVLKVTPDGEILREISIFDVLINNGLQGLLYMQAKYGDTTEVTGDTLHLNDVEIFPSHLRRACLNRATLWFRFEIPTPSWSLTLTL